MHIVSSRNGENYLRREPSRLRKSKPQVTVAIGLVCHRRERIAFQSESFIVLASDSQTTHGATKSLDAQKISTIEFKLDSILVAQSGTADLAEKTISIMRERARGVVVESPDTIIRIAQNSIREVRDYLIEINKGCGFSDDAWKRFFLEENYFQLLLAFYVKSKPYLYTIDIDWCLAIPIKEPYAAIGIGKNLASFLIRDYRKCDPSFEFGYTIAVSVVEKTIDNVDGCGRPTWVGWMYPVPEEAITADKPQANLSHAMILQKTMVDIVVEELNQSAPEEAAQQKARMAKLLRAVNTKFDDLILKMNRDAQS